MKEVSLYIYNEYTNNYTVLKKAPQEEIDRITTRFEDKQALINYLNDYSIISDIKILNIVNKERRVLYNWHIKQLEELSTNEKFLSYLEKEYPGCAEALDELIEPKNQSLEQYYKSIRKIYDIYEESYRKLGQPSLDKIYSRYKKRQKEETEQYAESFFKKENYQYKKNRGEK